MIRLQDKSCFLVLVAKRVLGVIQASWQLMQAQLFLHEGSGGGGCLEGLLLQASSELAGVSQ